MNYLVLLPFLLKELGSPGRAGQLGEDAPPEAWCPSTVPPRLRCVDTFRGYVGSLVTLGAQGVPEYVFIRKRTFKLRYFIYPLLSRLERVSCCKNTAAASPYLRAVVLANVLCC